MNDLTAKVKAAIQAGRDDLAAPTRPGSRWRRRRWSATSQQLDTAKSAYDKALNVKKMFMREKEKKTQEAMSAIRDARRAKWQSKVADAMESFEVAGIDATHDEMLRKVAGADRGQRGPHADGARVGGPPGAADRGRGREAPGPGAGEAVQDGDGPRRAPPRCPRPAEAAEKTIGKKVEVK